MTDKALQPSSDPSLQVELPSTNVDGGVVIEIAPRKDSVVDPSLESNDKAMAQDDADSEWERELFGPPSKDDASDVVDDQNQPRKKSASNGDTHADVMQVDDVDAPVVAVDCTEAANTQQLAVNEKRDSKSEQPILFDRNGNQNGTAKAPAQGMQLDGTTAAAQEDHHSKLAAQTDSGVGSQPASLQLGNPASTETTSQQNGATLSNGGDVTAASQNQVQMEQANSSAPENGQLGAMPPPAAPASMLYNIRASDTAKSTREQQKDPFVCSRLASAVVTLFRMGKAREAKALGQFAIDLMGEESWDEWLPLYMDEPPGKDDAEWVMTLLGDVAIALKTVDPASSGFLSILMSFMG